MLESSNDILNAEAEDIKQKFDNLILSFILFSATLLSWVWFVIYRISESLDMASSSLYEIEFRDSELSLLQIFVTLLTLLSITYVGGALYFRLQRKLEYFQRIFTAGTILIFLQIALIVGIIWIQELYFA